VKPVFVGSNDPELKSKSGMRDVVLNTLKKEKKRRSERAVK